MSEKTRNPRRVKREVETAEYGAMVRRMIAAYRRRITGENGKAPDIAALRGLVELRDDLDAAISVAGRRLHANGYSFTQLADELGVHRSAARQRFGVGRKWCLDCYSTLVADMCPVCDAA